MMVLVLDGDWGVSCMHLIAEKRTLITEAKCIENTTYDAKQIGLKTNTVQICRPRRSNCC